MHVHPSTQIVFSKRRVFHFIHFYFPSFIIQLLPPPQYTQSFLFWPLWLIKKSIAIPSFSFIPCFSTDFPLGFCLSLLQFRVFVAWPALSVFDCGFSAEGLIANLVEWNSFFAKYIEGPMEAELENFVNQEGDQNSYKQITKKKSSYASLTQIQSKNIQPQNSNSKIYEIIENQWNGHKTCLYARHKRAYREIDNPSQNIHASSQNDRDDINRSRWRMPTHWR